MERRTITLDPEVYKNLSILKARESLRLKRALDWDGFFRLFIERARRRKEILSWAYASVIFLAITWILLWPVYLYSPGLIPVIWGLGLAIAAVSVYLLTPLALRRNALLMGHEEVKEWVTELATKAGLREAPVVVVFETREINAMAYRSPKGGRICVTRGLLEAYESGEITPDEFKAIIAHEIGHLKHRDLLKFGLALAWVDVFQFVGIETVRVGDALGEGAEEGEGWLSVLVMFASMFVILTGLGLLLVARLASLLSFHLSRREELEADDLAAEITHPNHMAMALDKIERLNERLLAKELEKLPYADRWQLQPRNATWIERLWDTHPPTPSRTGRLRALQEAM